MTKFNPNAKSKIERNTLLSAEDAPAKPESKPAGKGRQRQFSLLNDEELVKTESEADPPAGKANAEQTVASKMVIREKPTQKAEPKPEPKKASAARNTPAATRVLLTDPVRATPRKKKKSKAPLIVLIAVVACLVAAYIGGIFLWKDMFLPHTFINGQDVSNLKADDAEQLLLPGNTDYEITELARSESIPLSDFAYTLTFTQPITGLIENQNRFAWPLSLISETHYDNAVNIAYDKSLLEKALLSLDAFNEDIVVEPADAYLGETKDGHYEIIPEVTGDQLDENKVIAYVEESLDAGDFSIDLTETDSYLLPSVYSDDKKLAEDLKFVKAVGEETITIDLTDATEVLEPFDLKDFVTIDANDEMIINEDYLWEYVTDLSNRYNTYLSERNFTTHNGQKIKVGGNHTKDYGIDTYGFLMNRSATVEILRDCILSKSDQYMTPAWDVPALTRNADNGDIGDTYIELSLNEQHLWYYIDGKLFFESDVVTGLDTDARRTPWGIFRAYEKDKDCILKGEMAGDRWNTHVDYWISVTWTGVGIHDATWQPGFGGDLYKYYGSHGCINVSLDTAKTLYDTLEIDTPIIVY